jgi:hypothetical protein
VTLGSVAALGDEGGGWALLARVGLVYGVESAASEARQLHPWRRQLALERCPRLRYRLIPAETTKQAVDKYLWP